jgi:anaerobic magnesium-protoporphyrin IX monomethyl ester cyclase
MKALLVNLPIDNMITTNIPSYVEEQRGFYPPLGVMYVAAYAEQHTDYNVEILDMLAESTSYNELETEVRKRQPEIVGITATTFTLIDVMIAARIVKSVDRGIKVVLGGPHVHIYPEETIRLPEVDYLVLGEGEIPFTELLQNINNPGALKEVKGIVFKNNGKIINTGPRELNNELDTLPFPARHLTKINKYSSLLAKGGLVTTMITSRGCPYKCSFCYRPHLGKRFRARSAANVVDEMEQCVNMGIKEILVYDDTFTIDRRRVMDICNLILKRGLNIIWDIRTRVDIVDREMLESLKAAGCGRIHYGIESADPEILKVLQKGVTLPQVESAFKMTKEAGISTLAYFMFGSPTETREQMLNTINFAKRLDPDYCHFSVLTPFPATPIYLMGLEKGIFKDYWREFATNPTKDFKPKPWEENLSQDELAQLLKYAYRSFYIRPRYVLKQMLKVRSASEFMRKAKAGLKVFKR